MPARRATELQPEVPALLDTLALALAQDKQFDEAVKVLHEAFDLGSDEEATVYAGTGR